MLATHMSEVSGIVVSDLDFQVLIKAGHQKVDGFRLEDLRVEKDPAYVTNNNQ